jgi:hypothetical protein
VPPGSAPAAVDALTRMADDDDLRERMVESGVARVLRATTAVEVRRVAEFFEAG